MESTGVRALAGMRLFLKNAAFLIIVPGTTIGLVPCALIRTGRGSFPPGFLAVPGTLLAGGGVALVLACVWSFGRHGRGTPLPLDPPKFLVMRGPHGLVRNPMYLGVLAAVLGEGLRFGSGAVLCWAALLAGAFHAFVVFYEEPALERLFGEEYVRYRTRVPRWLPTAGKFR